MLYYVRHGETVWNRAQKLQGRRDSPLTLRGVELAIAYGKRLHIELDGAHDVELVTSPMGRARQTAAIIADLLGDAARHVVVNDLLAEHDVGDWAGLSWKEVAVRHGVTVGALRDPDLRPPNGETRREVLDRATRWLTSERAAVTIAVSHGGFSRLLRGSYLGLAFDEMATLPVHDHGRLYRLAAGECHEIVTEPEAPGPEELLG